MEGALTLDVWQRLEAIGGAVVANVVLDGGITIVTCGDVTVQPATKEYGKGARAAARDRRQM